MSVGTELAIQGQQSYSLPDLQVMAKQVAGSKLFGGAESEQAAFTLMLLCQAEGLHPINAMRRYHIIKGRPTMRADAMQAEFQRQGGIVRWEKSDKDSCRARFVHKIHAPEPGFSVEVWWEECSAAGNTDMYRKFPAPMLRARCISQGVRAVLPGVVVGIYTPEEIEIDITPVEMMPPPPVKARTIETPKPSSPAKPIELPSDRKAVNAEFAPKSAEPEPSRYPVKELTSLPFQKISSRGLDTRNWPTIVTDEAEGLNREVAAWCEKGQSEVFEATSGHRVVNHLVTAIIATNPEAEEWFSEEKKGKRVRFGPGKLNAELGVLYADGWREWLRIELSSYLAEKRDKAENEIFGDRPIDTQVELQSQESSTAPEDASQDIETTGGTLDRGDAYEGPE